MNSGSSDHGESHPQVCCRGCARLLPDMMALIEALSQKVDSMETTVKEEVVGIKSSVKEVLKRTALPPFPPGTLQDSTSPVPSRSLSHQGESSASKRFLLRIDDARLPETLYTKTKLKDHQGGSLKVELLDDSGSRVENGSESSANIKFAVLKGDFEPEDKNWTDEDFKRHIVSPRKGKGDLGMVEKKISLSRGEASVADLSFTENTRRDTVRLCVQVLKPPPGVYIRGAVSKPFTVKERRGRSARKTEKPCLDNELWRLKHIGRIVYKRAEDEKICTVQDFLQLYHTDPNRLQSILKVPDTNWREIVEQAEACELSSKCYRYTDDTKGVELLLNCVFKIESATFRGQPYDSLDDHQKQIVDEVRRAAWAKRNDLKTYTPLNTPRNQMQMQSPTDHIQLHTNADEMQMHSSPDQLQVYTNPSPMQMHNNADQMQMHSPPYQLQVYTNPSPMQMHTNVDQMQMHTPTSQTHIHANSMQMHSVASQTPMQIHDNQMQMYNSASQIQKHIPANHKMHTPAYQMQMHTPANQMQMQAELSWSTTMPSSNVGHLNVKASHQGIPVQNVNSYNAGVPFDHFEYDGAMPFQSGEAALGVSDISLFGDFPDVLDCFLATTSNAPSVVDGAGKLATRVNKDNWLLIRAVMKFKFVRKVSEKQSPRPLKRNKFSSD